MKILKYIIITLLTLAFLIYLGYRYFIGSIQPQLASKNKNTIEFSATRLTNDPIIYPEMHPKLIAEAKAYGYTNINGPSLIKVPDWVDNKLGKYYLYFAHHKGAFIRLAYADTLTGPWTMSDEEIMPLEQAGLATEATPVLGLMELKKQLQWTELFAMIEVGGKAKKAWEERTKQKMKSSPPTTPHVASPEIFIDDKKKQIRLYYHGVKKGNLQMSKVALSTNGLNFQPEPEIIGLPYMRVFQHQGEFFGFAMPGFFYRSKDGLSGFKVRNQWLFETNVRHSAIYKKDDELYLFFSRVGDAPEQILYTKLDISSPNWNEWKAEPAKTLLTPTEVWEGANEALVPSMRGEMGTMVNQLRDPAIYEEDGQLYLLYTGAGEQAIGIAKINQSSEL